MVKLLEAPLNLFVYFITLHISQNYDGFRQNNLQGFQTTQFIWLLELMKTVIKRTHLKLFSPIYQNYTRSLAFMPTKLC